MRITRYCLDSPIAVTLFYALVGLAGIASLFFMGRSILPPVALPVVAISAPYPGAGSADIERLVIEPLEDRLAPLPDLEHVDASAQNGFAAIAVQFRFGSNIEADRAGVQQAVDAARALMPSDLLPPIVTRSNPAQAPVFEEAVSSALVDPGSLSDLLDKRILPQLRTIPGAGAVQITGQAARQFTVEPRAGALNALGATLLDVLRAAQASNDVLPGGTLRSQTAESSIGINGAAATAPQIENLPLSIPGRASIRIGDIAGVQDAYADTSTISRVDGEPAAIVSITQAPGTDAMATIRAARRTLARLARQYPQVRFDELRSDEPSTNAAVAGVFQTLGEGVALTVLVMLFFLHAWRNAAIAAVAIPASLCAAFAAMWALGLTMNVLSLMGLSLTIGILVDDSIVIIEAVSLHFEGGMRAYDAALAGRSELGAAAFAITLVDVAVFAPIAFMGGIVGEFMREFGLVVVIATGFSLLVSLTLTPLLASLWGLRRTTGPLQFSRYPWTLRTKLARKTILAWHAMLHAFGALERRFAETYARRWLPAALQRPRATAAIATLLCSLSFIPLLAGQIPTEFSPPVGRGVASVDLTLPAGTPLLATDAAALRINDALSDDARIAHIEERTQANVAHLSIVLRDPNENGDALVERVKAFRTLVPSASIAGAGKGMGGAPGVSFTIAGDPGAISTAAARIAAALRASPNATDVRTSDAGLAPRAQIRVDTSRAQILNVSDDDAAQTARLAAGGSIAARARSESGLEDVLVRSGAAQRGDLDAMGRFTVRSTDGRLVPLEDISRVSFTREPVVIEREDGARIVTVSANAAAGAPISAVSTGIAARMRDPAFLPPGARVKPGGDLQQFLDTVTKILAALIASLLGVYVILAVLYRSYVLPCIIMLTVPLASSGAFGTLFLLNVLRVQSQTINLYSMLGIVMLCGLVAKNGILLVEYAERAVREGAPARRAMLQAAQRRFRPIVMTTAAMIAGMLPLAAGHTIGAEYRRALGTVVIGGLSSSLLLTLFVVPVAYVWYRGAESSMARRTMSNAVDAC